MRYNFILLSLVLCLNVKAQYGSLDLTFGLNGKVITDMGLTPSQASSIKILSDDKIIVAGDHYNSNTNNDFAILRYTSDGELDLSFGNQGKVYTDYNQLSNIITSITVLSNNKILAIGTLFNENENENDFIFARFNQDGSLDSSFGNNGFVVNDFQNRKDIPYNAVELADGSFIVTGESKLGIESKLIVAKYNSDMTLDMNFGTTGYFLDETNFYNKNSIGNALYITPDNNILVSGRVFNVGFYNDFAIWKLDIHGSLDTTFGNNGKLLIDFFQTDDYLVDMKVLDNGKMILAGGTNEIFLGAPMRYCIAQLNADGTLDSTFGVLGKVIYTFDPNAGEIPSTFIRRQNGALVLGGYFVNSGNYDFGLLFLNADGSQDIRYGNNGWVATTFIGNDYLYGLAEQSDGKIIASGHTGNSSTNPTFAMARYDTDTSLTSASFYKDHSIRVYPNPVNNELNITFNSIISTNISARIFDNNGREISISSLNNNINNFEQTITLNTFSELSKGIYFLNIILENKSYNFKIIK